MIRVYFLPVETIDGTEIVAGSEFMLDALLLGTEQPDIRKLIMDTTPDEFASLAPLAIETREPTQAELDQFNDLVVITPPDPDTIRAEEILSSSPEVITMPKIWELLRIIGRRLDYRFD